MKKTKTQKGITLIALIITIIVLLILAVVAINAVQDDGIINYAKNARNEYEKAQANESTLLGNYINYIEENVATVEIIEFTIDGTTYKAEKGMDFYTWCNSNYNKTEYKCNSKTAMVLYVDASAREHRICSDSRCTVNVIGENIIQETQYYETFTSGRV